ncbi:MAG: hypothetical protein HYZ44_03605 [Bacteroidetes bacterium]|nr:hypothetical protein [Bacteroidota bacterium]
MEFAKIEGIDVEIQIVFKASHLPILTPYFLRAGVSQSKIDSIIDEYIESGENLVFERWFLDTCQKKINPEMNKFLGREINHPTFNRLLNVALRAIIEKDTIVVHLRKSRRNLQSESKSELKNE